MRMNPSEPLGGGVSRPGRAQVNQGSSLVAQAAPLLQSISWRTGRAGFTQVHFLREGEHFTLCGRKPDGLIDWDPPLTTKTMCRTCAQQYCRPLKVVR